MLLDQCAYNPCHGIDVLPPLIPFPVSRILYARDTKSAKLTGLRGVRYVLTLQGMAGQTNLNEEPYTNYCSNCGDLVDDVSLFA